MTGSPRTFPRVPWDEVLGETRMMLGASVAVAFRLYARGELLVMDEARVHGGVNGERIEARLQGIALPPSHERDTVCGLGLERLAQLSPRHWTRQVCGEPTALGIALTTKHDIVGGLALFGPNLVPPDRVPLNILRTLVRELTSGLANVPFSITLGRDGRPVNPSPEAAEWLRGGHSRSEQVFEMALRGGILGGARLTLLPVQPGHLSLISAIPHAFEPLPAALLLDETQRRVADLLASGSPPTDLTRRHRQATFERLGVRSRLELARILNRPIGKWYKE